jgi:hypothetical protein
MAPAATEVTADGGSAATTRVDSPASASEMAAVKPTTPAPTTTMSTAAMNSTVQDPLVADEDAAPDIDARHARFDATGSFGCQRRPSDRGLTKVTVSKSA